jgi:hemerythrin-like domain-containing protein
MPQAPNLLNDDGSASMATMLMMSHHAFRRDISRLLRAIEQIKSGDISRAEAVRGEWELSYRLALHGHHTIEDTKLFPDIRAKHPELASSIDKLADQHHHIDPIIEKGNAAFADLSHPENAEAVLHELKALLDEHLVFEEAQVTPFLRDSKDFPVPPDEAAANMYAEGFAWSMQGIAPEVLDQVVKMLPEILLAKIPATRVKFEEHSKEVWGTYSVGAATTPIPEVY